MKTTTIAITIGCFATPLFANNPPAPQTMLAVISILPLMAVLTFAGGGYALMRRLNLEKHTGWKIAAVICALIFGAMSESYMVLVALGFAIAATVRAVHLIRWGFMARKADPEGPFREVSPPRMIIAGALVISMVIVATATTLAFFGTFDWGIEYRYPAMRKYVAYRLALRTPPSPQRSKLEADAAKNFEDYESHMNRFRSTKYVRFFRIEERKDGHFSVYLLPQVMKFPFWPYDRWFSVPTYRADDNGDIRMTYVHSRQWCPPNGPVVDRVSASDVMSVLNGNTRVEEARPESVPGSKRRR